MADPHDLDPNMVVSHDLAGGSHYAKSLELAEYWTAERMAAAKAFDLQLEGDAEPVIPAPPIDLLRTPDSEERRGEPHSGEKFAEALRLPPPFDTARVSNSNNFPYSAIGKLFVRVNGVDRCGTAFVVGARAIVTAGHCLFAGEGSQWADRAAFVPRYTGGTPGSTDMWHAGSLHVLAGWAAQRPNARLFDLGGAILDRPIGDATGVIGWLANLPARPGSVHAVGYPLQWVSPQYPFDGNQMWRCNGPSVPASGVLKMANNMTEGASGGPWLIQRDGNIYANGVNSFRLTSEPNALASPYFGQGFVNLMQSLV